MKLPEMITLKNFVAKLNLKNNKDGSAPTRHAEFISAPKHDMLQIPKRVRDDVRGMRCYVIKTFGVPRFRKVRTMVSVAIALALVVTTFPLAAFLSAKPAKAAWYNDDWHYRKSILFTHSGAESNVYLNLSGANALDTSASGRYQSDCGDLRFTDGNGNVLPYFLVSGCGTSTTVIHVLYGTMPAGDQYLYVYYGNSTVANGTTSFDFSAAATGITFGSVGSEETSQGPVAEWKFDEGYGTTTKDSSTNNNSGTLTNSPTWQDPSMCVSGKCLYFNGTNSYVDAGTDNSMQVGTSSMTLSVWFRTSVTPGAGAYEVLVDTKGCYGNGAGFNLGFNSTNFWADFANGTTQIQVGTTGAPYIDGKWHNAQVTLQRGSPDNALLYIDGKKVASNTTTTGWNLTYANHFNIGRGNCGGSTYFNGSIDDVQLYNNARIQSQIQEDYNNGVASMNTQNGNLSNGLVGYWKMDDSVSGNAQTLKDTSGSGNNATTSNGANGTGMDCTVSGKFGGGCSFDGVDDYVNIPSPASGVLDFGTGDFSVSVWVNLSSLVNGETLLGKNFVGNGPGYGMRLNSSFQPTFWIGDGTNTLEIQNTLALTSNAWYQIVGMRRNGVASIFVNSQKSSSATSLTGSVTNAGSLNFGARNNGTQYNMAGKLDDIRIMNRALSVSEIQQLYNFGPPPMLYYNFEEGSGTTINDVSGNGNTGALSSSFTAGKYGSALLTTNNGKGVHSNTAMYHGTSSFTYEAWVKSADIDSNQSRIMGQSFTSGGYCYLNFGNGNILSECKDSNNVGGATTAVSTVNIADNKWHHVTQVVDRSANKIYFYVDGVLGLTYTTGYTGNLGVSSDPDNLYVGYQYNNSPASLSLNGSIDEVKVYNYARSQYQVSQDYNAGTSALDSPVGWWKMDEGQGTTTSNSGNAGGSYTVTSCNWISAKYANGLDCNGGGKVTIGSSTAFSSPDLTTSMWVKVGTINSGDNFNNIILGNENYLTSGFRFGIRSTGAPIFWATQSGGTISVAGNPINDGAWHYLAFTYNSGTTTGAMYIDGRRVSSGTGTYLPSSNNFVINGGIGGAQDSNSAFDNVKWWNSALTSSDILADYNRAGSVKVGSAGTENVTTKSGATGTQPSNSKLSEYCVPGDTSSCAASISEWKFEEGSGTSVNDTSGNGNNGTWSGTGNHWVPGKIGTAGGFNGLNDFASTPVTNLPSGVTGRSVFGWVYVAAYPSTGYQMIDSYGKNNPTGSASALAVNSSGKVSFNSQANDFVSSYTVPLNQWHFIGYTYNGGTSVTIWYDGASQTGTISQALTTTLGTSNCIGSWLDSNGACTLNYWNGKIDQLRIYNYARTPAQVAWEFNKGGPVAWYKMDECSGSTVHSSTNPYNAALNGTITIGATGTQTAIGTCQTSGTAWGNGASGKRGASLNFDGTDDYVSTGTTTFSANSGFTVAGWFKLSGSQGHSQYIFGGQTGFAGLYFLNGSTSGLRFDNGGGTYACGSQNNLTTGMWYHFVATNTMVQNDATSRKIYINGKNDTGGCSAITTTVTAQVNSIGYDGYSFHGFNFQGQIDDIQLFNYVLTPTQIATLYNGGSVYWGQ